MQAHSFIDETNLGPDSTDTKQALRVVIAYDDFAAGRRAVRVMADLGKGLGDEIEFQQRTATNNVRQCSGAVISGLVHIARSIQPFPHGGINE